PGSQLPLHRPAAQVACAMWLLEQARRHSPQFEASVAMSISQPLGTSASQSFQVVLQEAMPHVPARQARLAWNAVPHFLSHAPQLLLSCITSTSQPSSKWTLQSRKPVSAFPASL